MHVQINILMYFMICQVKTTIELKMPRGMGHRPSRNGENKPCICVGHYTNLSPLENILLLLMVGMVQRGARTSRSASQGFGEKEIKV